MGPERFYDTTSLSLDLAMGFPDWNLAPSPLQSHVMAEASKITESATSDLLCPSDALVSAPNDGPKESAKAGTGVLMPAFPAALSEQPVLTTPAAASAEQSSPAATSGNDRELASLLYTSVRQPTQPQRITKPESPLAGSNISLSSPEMSTEIYRQAQEEVKKAQSSPSAGPLTPNAMSLELSSPEMSTEFHKQALVQQLKMPQVKAGDATASLELSSPDLSTDFHRRAHEQLLKMNPNATEPVAAGAAFGSAIYAGAQNPEPVAQLAASGNEASLTLPGAAQNPTAESKDLSQALEQATGNTAINSRELSFGNSFAFRQSAAGNSAASVDGVKASGGGSSVLRSNANNGVGLPPRANSPPLYKASAASTKLHQRDARRNRLQNLLETPGKVGAAQGPKVARAAGNGVGSWKATGVRKQAAAPAVAQRDALGGNDSEAEVQDALRSQLQRITPPQGEDNTAKLFVASAAAGKPVVAATPEAAATTPAAMQTPEPVSESPSDIIAADELQQHQKEAEMLLSEMWESLTHNAELFSPSKRASSPLATSPAGSAGDSSQTKRSGSGDSGASLPPRSAKIAAKEGGHRRRNSAISAHGGQSATSAALDALLNTSGSPSHRHSDQDKMLRDYRPNIDDIMNSYTSYASATSARPPRSSRQCAEPAARKRRQRKNKAKMDDLMYSSITSGRSFADSAALNTMASTVGGERVSVRRAVPSIAHERPEPEENEGKDTPVKAGDAAGDDKASEAGSGKPARKKWFKVTGFVCCFTGNTKEAHLHGESMMPPPEQLAAKAAAAAAAAGVTVLPTDTPGAPSPHGTPNSAMSALRGMFSGTPRNTPRVSGTQLRNQIRDEMYDPEKETNVLMSCF